MQYSGKIKPAMVVMVSLLVAGSCGKDSDRVSTNGVVTYFSTLEEALEEIDSARIENVILRLWPDAAPGDCYQCLPMFRTRHGVVGFEFSDWQAAGQSEQAGLASLEQSLALTATLGGVALWQWIAAGGMATTIGYKIYVSSDTTRDSTSRLVSAVAELAQSALEKRRMWGQVFEQVLQKSESEEPGLGAVLFLGIVLAESAFYASLAINKNPVASFLTCDDQVIHGDTSGKTNNLPRYSCTQDRDYSGPEQVYPLRPGISGDLTVRLVKKGATGEWETGVPDGPHGPVRLDLFVLEQHQSDSFVGCLVGGNLQEHFAAQEDMLYYLVVDGYQGDEGKFNLKIECD